MEKEIRMSYGEFMAWKDTVDRYTKENEKLKDFLDRSGAYQIVIKREKWCIANEWRTTTEILHWNETAITKHIKEELNRLTDELEVSQKKYEVLRSKWYVKLFLWKN